MEYNMVEPAVVLDTLKVSVPLAGQVALVPVTVRVKFDN